MASAFLTTVASAKVVRRKIAIALGSNVGDRHAVLRSAIEALAPWVRDLRASSFYDTPYVGSGPAAFDRAQAREAGHHETQAPVLNAAAIGVSSLDAHALIERLLAIEQDFGRTRPYSGAPRTLDLDLILYGDAIIDEPGLQVPHPRFRERRFVLEPLAEIAPDWRDPVSGHSIAELLKKVVGSG